MTSKEYLDYLIATSEENFELKIQPMELKFLKVLIEKEENERP